MARESSEWKVIVSNQVECDHVRRNHGWRVEAELELVAAKVKSLSRLSCR